MYQYIAGTAGLAGLYSLSYYIGRYRRQKEHPNPDIVSIQSVNLGEPVRSNIQLIEYPHFKILYSTVMDA